MKLNLKVGMSKWMLKSVLTLFTLCFAVKADAQTIESYKMGQGLRVKSDDGLFYMKFTTRLQNRFVGTYIKDADPEYVEQFYLRRARLKFDGFAGSKKLVYKIEYDVVNAEMLDAVIKWNFAGNFNLWVGQTKLAGNRERVISSQKLQFVDRSLLNSKFQIDRDKGIQLRHHFSIGNVLFREVASVSVGEGKNYSGKSEGRDYTGRLEILPFGKFAGKGDYFGGDLKREEKPKLALGFTYDYNDNAIRARGQKGDFMTETRDLKTIFADMMFKCHGFSWMFEYAKREADGGAVIYDDTQAFLESYYTGTSINNTFGYLMKNNWEVSVRYTEVTPEEETLNNDLKEYTLGISRYISGHNLKVQGDISLLEEATMEDQVVVRLQLEVAL